MYIYIYKCIYIYIYSKIAPKGVGVPHLGAAGRHAWPKT